MILSNNEIEIYESINFEERYLKIMNDHDHDNYMSNPDKDKILEIFDSLKYKAKYFKSEKFYAVREKTGSLYIYFHVSVKTGGCELLYYAGKISPKKHLIGGSAGWIYKDISEYKGVNGVNIKLPAFSNYEELESILKEGLLLYDDFKSEVIKLLS